MARESAPRLLLTSGIFLALRALALSSFFGIHRGGLCSIGLFLLQSLSLSHFLFFFFFFFFHFRHRRLVGQPQLKPFPARIRPGRGLEAVQEIVAQGSPKRSLGGKDHGPFVVFFSIVVFVFFFFRITESEHTSKTAEISFFFSISGCFSIFNWASFAPRATEIFLRDFLLPSSQLTSRTPEICLRFLFLFLFTFAFHSCARRVRFFETGNPLSPRLSSRASLLQDPLPTVPVAHGTRLMGRLNLPGDPGEHRRASWVPVALHRRGAARDGDLQPHADQPRGRRREWQAGFQAGAQPRASWVRPQ